jgi:hypothetical protein
MLTANFQEIAKHDFPPSLSHTYITYTYIQTADVIDFENRDFADVAGEDFPNPPEKFAVLVTGWIEIDEAAAYKFCTNSSDGSVVSKCFCADAYKCAVQVSSYFLQEICL